MSIRIGEDGTIISTDGDIQQGQNPLIGEDGSIRLSGQSLSLSQSRAMHSRRPPTSPLEGGSNNRRESTNSSASSSTSLQASNEVYSRSVSTIEYEIQVKRAELGKCIRPIPIIICVVSVLLAVLFSTPLFFMVSAITAVPIVIDVFRRSQVSEEVRNLELELKKARNRGDR